MPTKKKNYRCNKISKTNQVMHFDRIGIKKKGLSHYTLFICNSNTVQTNSK